jgi:hypothetical protein
MSLPVYCWRTTLFAAISSTSISFPIELVSLAPTVLYRPDNLTLLIVKDFNQLLRTAIVADFNSKQ